MTASFRKTKGVAVQIYLFSPVLARQSKAAPASARAFFFYYIHSMRSLLFCVVVGAVDGFEISCGIERVLIFSMLL